MCMVADMDVDMMAVMQVDMVADMVVDKVADMEVATITKSPLLPSLFSQSFFKSKLRFGLFNKKYIILTFFFGYF